MSAPKPTTGPLAERIAAMLPPRRKLRLVPYTAPATGLETHRRDDCARLAGCEQAWIDEHGSDDAACPPRCLAFVRRGAA